MCPVPLNLRLQEDMKRAMKSGQRQRLDVIRMLLSDVKNVDLAPRPTTPEQAVEAYGKKLRKSLDEFARLGRTAEVEKLRQEIAIVDEYLPAKANEQETSALVDVFISTHSFTQKQLGQAMGAMMKQHGSAVDAEIVSRLLRQKLPAGQS